MSIDNKENKIKLTLKKLNLVATWNYGIETQDCKICKKDLMMPVYEQESATESATMPALEPVPEPEPESAKEPGPAKDPKQSELTDMKDRSLNIKKKKKEPKKSTLSADVTIGACEHGFHTHCINQWISEGNVSCPYCQTMWKGSKSVGSGVCVYESI